MFNALLVGGALAVCALYRAPSWLVESAPTSVAESDETPATVGNSDTVTHDEAVLLRRSAANEATCEENVSPVNKNYDASATAKLAILRDLSTNAAVCSALRKPDTGNRPAKQVRLCLERNETFAATV